MCGPDTTDVWLIEFFELVIPEMIDFKHFYDPCNDNISTNGPRSCTWRNNCHEKTLFIGHFWPKRLKFLTITTKNPIKPYIF